MQEPLDLGMLKVFLAVARTGGFASGGQAVGLTRSAAGKAIKRLEERLGVRLLHRTNRRVGLTGEGQTFYHRCHQIMSELDEAEAEIRQDNSKPRGLLRLTVPETFGRRQVLPIVNAYLRDWPGLTAEISVTDRLTDLVEEGYDLAVRCGGRLSDTTLIARVIARFGAVVCAAPDYLASRGEPRTIDDLLQHSRLMLGDGGGVRPWSLTPPNGVPQRLSAVGRVHLNNGEALRQAALDGLGIAYLPSFLVGSDIEAGHLCALLGDHDTEQVPVHAVYPSRQHLPTKVRMLVDRLVAGFGSA